MEAASYSVATESDPADHSSSGGQYAEAAVGVDVGTAYCSVAVWRDSRVEVLANAQCRRRLPANVMFKENSTGGLSLTGGASEQELLSGSAIFNVKRLVGRIDTDPVVHSCKHYPFVVQSVDVGMRPYLGALGTNVWRSTTPEEVLAVLLSELKAMAEAHIGQVVRSAVLTVPVSFSRFQQSRVERACSMAGLEVQRLMPEPSAVALVYAQQQQQANKGDVDSSSVERVALIFNMGAGYTDVSLTTTAGGISEIKAVAGDVIGGEDLLHNLISYLVLETQPLLEKDENALKRIVSQLQFTVERAMLALSNHDSTHIETTAGGVKFSKTITREVFQAVNSAVFLRCQALVQQCLDDANMDPDNINDVILVGGCSRIPKIRALLQKMCHGKEAYTGIDPLEAAVCGAALEGAITAGLTDPSGSLDLLTIQVTPLSLGVRLSGGEFTVILPRNTTIPTRRDVVLTTSQANQTEAIILVYEGEGTTVKDNHLLGILKITGIPPAPKGVPLIDVCLDVDASNALRLVAGVTMPQTQTPVTPLVEARLPNLDDGHVWCLDAIDKRYGTSRDVALHSSLQPNV